MFKVNLPMTKDVRADNEFLRRRNVQHQCIVKSGIDLKKIINVH